MKFVHSTTERERIPCTFLGCEKTFVHKGGVTKHFNSEHAENPIRYLCTLCQKEFKSMKDLTRHIDTHTREKSYKCTICGKGFGQAQNLKRHEVSKLIN